MSTSGKKTKCYLENCNKDCHGKKAYCRTHCKLFWSEDEIRKDKEKHEKYYLKNRERILQRMKKKYNEIKDTIEWKNHRKSFYQENKEKILKDRKIYFQKSKELINKSRKKRWNSNLNFRLGSNLRRRLNHYLKSGSAVRDLGCSIPELKIWLEQQFYPNPETGEQMSWENWSYNGWHIDHVVPLCNFDLTDRKQLLKACHWFNLQPLWAKENLRKGDRT
jgi:hypothetical protein